MNPQTRLDSKPRRSALDTYYDEYKDARSDHDGRLLNGDGRRTMLVGDHLLLGLQAVLEEDIGDAAGELLYMWGCEWGKRNVISFEERFVHQFGAPPADMVFDLVLRAWWWPMQASGWGRWSYDLSQCDEGLIFVDVWDTLATHATPKPAACHFYAGMFAAVFGHFANRELSAIELQCSCTGESHCRFLIGSTKRINAPRFWRERTPAAGGSYGL